MSLSFAVLLEVIYIYFLYGMGRFIENYDYASPDKLASQNGLNLSFLRFSPTSGITSAKRWPAGTTTSPRRSASASTPRPCCCSMLIRAS